MNKITLCLILSLVVLGCTGSWVQDLGYVPDPELRQWQHDEYKNGYAAAKADMRNGLLRF